MFLLSAAIDGCEQIAAGDPQQNEPDRMGGVLVLLKQLTAGLGVQRGELRSMVFNPCLKAQAKAADGAEGDQQGGQRPIAAASSDRVGGISHGLLPALQVSSRLA